MGICRGRLSRSSGSAMESAAGRLGRGLIARPRVLAAEEAIREFCRLRGRGGETITAPGGTEILAATALVPACRQLGGDVQAEVFQECCELRVELCAHLGDLRGGEAGELVAGPV